MTRRHVPCAALPTMILIGVLLGVPGSALAGGDGNGKGKPKPPPPDPAPAILFHAGEDIHAMNDDGSNATLILENTGGGVFTYPGWSPDGTQIVFNGNMPPNGEGLYVANADGTGLTFLTPAFSVGSPDWSPVPAADGNYKILFDDYNELTEEGDIFAINPDGTGRVNLTNTPDRDEWGGVSWSPQADAFARVALPLPAWLNGGRDECFVYEVGLVNGQLETVGEMSVTNVPGSPLESAGWMNAPDWGNTGDRVVLTVEGDQLWVMDLADPTNPLHLTAGVNWNAGMPVWSPDDSMIAFRKSGPGPDGIFVMSSAGSDPEKLTGFGIPSDWK